MAVATADEGSAFEDGIARPSELAPVFLQVTVSGGLFAFGVPGGDTPLYVIGKHRIVQSAKRVVLPARAYEEMGVRWYLVNASPRGGGVWVCGCAEVAGATMPAAKPVPRGAAAAAWAQEAKDRASLPGELAAALHGAFKDSVEFALRTAVVLADLEAMARVFRPTVEKQRARQAVRDAALRLIQKEEPGDAEAAAVSANLKAAADRAAVDALAQRDVKLTPLGFLDVAASAAAETHDARGALWDIVEAVVGAVRALDHGAAAAPPPHMSHFAAALRADVIVGFAATNASVNVRDLLKRNYAPAGPNSLHSKSRISALNAAAKAGANAAVRVLLEFGADVNRKDDAVGLAPLHTAARWGRVAAAALLLAAGAMRDLCADVYGTDGGFEASAGPRPCDVARAAGHDELARLLRVTPPPVLGFSVVGTTEDACTVNWPPAFTRARDEADVEKYRVTCECVGVAGVDGTRVFDFKPPKAGDRVSPAELARRRSSTVAPGTFSLTLHMLPTLTGLRLTISPCCVGDNWGPPSSPALLAFTTGRPPAAPARPRVIGVSRDELRVEFKTSRDSHDVASVALKRSRTVASKNRLTPILEFEAQAWRRAPPEPRNDEYVSDDEALDAQPLAVDGPPARETAWPAHNATWEDETAKDVLATVRLSTDEADEGGIVDPSVRIPGLGSFYRSALHVRVRARNSQGWGQWSPSSVALLLQTPRVRAARVEARCVALEWPRICRLASTYEVIMREAREAPEPAAASLQRRPSLKQRKQTRFEIGPVGKPGTADLALHLAARADALSGQPRGRSDAPPDAAALRESASLPGLRPRRSSVGSSPGRSSRGAPSPSRSPSRGSSRGSRRGRTAHRLDKDARSWTVAATDLDALNFVVKGLMPGRIYDFCVRALPVFADACPWAEAMATKVAIRTLPLPPEAPPPPTKPQLVETLEDSPPVRVPSRAAACRAAARSREGVVRQKRRKPPPVDGADVLGRCVTLVRAPEEVNGGRCVRLDLQIVTTRPRPKLDAHGGDLAQPAEDEATTDVLSCALDGLEESALLSAAAAQALDAGSSTVGDACVVPAALGQPPRAAFSLWLLPARRYELRSRAANAAGDSVWSDAFYVDTPTCLPPAPPEVLERTSSAVVLRISRPRLPKALQQADARSLTETRVLGYDVRYRDVHAAAVHARRGDGMDIWETAAVDADAGKAAARHRLAPLVPICQYEIQVRARNALGYSVFSEPLVVTTPAF
ncbi:hypothetical protein M885DRAFT_626060 [Pelagophyceae sp. CCMP2097]|nr:hypothetical protein M885DRAFT_626060 [Pelagophyceae sp. CCMP2097]